jgi:hypothetical protein
MKQLMFSLLLIVLAVGLVSAQNVVTAPGLVVVNVAAGTALALTPTDGAVSALSPGYTYKVDPIGLQVLPLINGSESCDQIPEWLVEGDLGAEVNISFMLPTKLIGALSGSIPVSFGPYDAYIVENLTAFNPNVPFTGNLGGSGTLTIDIGFTVVVPANAGADDYTGTIVGTVAYTGL